MAQRTYKWAANLWWAVAVVTIMVTLCTFHVQPQTTINLKTRPWGILFLIMTPGSFLLLRYFLNRRQPHFEKWAFFASCFFCRNDGQCVCGNFSEYSSSTDPSASSDDSKRCNGSIWIKNSPVLVDSRILLTIGYFVFLYSRLPKKLKVDKKM